MDKKVIIISSCKDCKQYFLGYTESDWYCKKMPIGKDTFRKIYDISKIHPLCPLQDMEDALKRQSKLNKSG